MTKSLVPVEDLQAAYSEMGSVYRVAKAFGLSPSTVQERLQKAEYDGWKRRSWTDRDDETLRREYRKCADAGSLAGLAAVMGRTKPFIARKAAALGLTNQSGPAPWSRTSRNLPHLRGGEHPRGMKGKSHGVEARSAMADAHTARFAAMSQLERDALEDAKIAGRKAANNLTPDREAGDAKKSWRAGWREIGRHRKYFRSQWEANYARYLEWLRLRGEIVDWEHEPKTFWFEGIRRGVCSYKPDFRVIEKDGTAVWHEVKGWMDDRSRVALNRIRKFYPDEVVILIDKDAYKAIKGKVMRFIEGWE